MSSPRGPRELFAELVTKVDDFFDRVHARHRARMHCAKGCSDCCHARLSVTLLEAAALAQCVSELPAEQREALADWAARDDDSACAALAESGDCLVYAARPLICRSHGVPIRYGRQMMQGEKPANVRLPVVTACFKNFGGGNDFSTVEDNEVLDQTTVSATLGALDAAFADECGAPRGTRIDLAALLRNPGEFFDV